MRRTTPGPCRKRAIMPRELVPTSTLGIDLASQAKETGVCRIDWSGGGGRVADLGAQVLDDDRLVELMLDECVAKVGIDAPLGWPLAWVDALESYRDHTLWPSLETSELRFRATDFAVKEAGKNPMSVATDLLVWPTIRCAKLLGAASGGQPIDRAGGGRIAEVYPGAALKRFGLLPPETPITSWRYKEPARPKAPDSETELRRENRAHMLDRILEELPTLEINPEFRARCEADDDPLDALVCALVARAVELGLCDPIPAGNRWQAMREGWIHLPREGSLAQLA